MIPSKETTILPNQQTAVIIPTLNNELSIGSLVLLARQYASYVIVVDDGSEDKTVTVAEQAGGIVLRTSEYGGRGRVLSILTGCRRALAYGCTAVVFFDSTGKDLAREIPHLVEPILSGKADLVIGSRYIRGRKGIPAYQFNNGNNNHNGNNNKNGKNDNIKQLAELPEKHEEVYITDPNSTFRALSEKAITLLDVLPEDDHFESMMITFFSKRNLSVVEIPASNRGKHSSLDDEENACKIAVVVPAHNEELLIGETLSGIPDYVSRVYVVNDCSTDRTQKIIDYFAEHDHSIIPIVHETNKGVGAAIISGYRQALADGMDIVAVMAGDNQMDPAFLPDLLNPIVNNKCDYTMGNRLLNPKYRKGMSRWRFSGNAILTMLTKIASGYWQIMDPQNGYTAISKRALEHINLDDVYPRYGYCNDLLVRLNVVGFRVINVPHPARYGLERSGIKYHTYIVRVSRLLLNDFLWRLKMKYVVLNFNPLVFFYIGGVIFSILGLLGGLYSLHYKFFQGHPIFLPLFISFIVFAMGLSSLFFAMLCDMQQESISDGWY
jgi:glycosyltransferase involved in cell wall biosynthesis